MLGLVEPCQELHQRALAGAAGADDSQGSAGGESEADVAQPGGRRGREGDALDGQLPPQARQAAGVGSLPCGKASSEKLVDPAPGRPRR